MFKFNVSQELREQIVNIIDDLVNDIAPGYLSPNSFSRFDYRTEIYEAAYKYLSAEFGMRRFEYVDYGREVFDFLREVPSEKFFNVIEHLLKVVFEIVHIQKAIPDDIIRNPHAGNELWSRKASVRDRHISLFKGAVDELNHRLSQHSTKHRYKLSGESVRMVMQDTELDVPKKKNGIEKKGDNQPPERQKKNINQPPEHHQNQSRSEFWNRKGYIIAVVAVILAVLEFAFGDGILIRPLRWVWNYLQTLL